MGFICLLSRIINPSRFQVQTFIWKFVPVHCQRKSAYLFKSINQYYIYSFIGLLEFGTVVYIVILHCFYYAETYSFFSFFFFWGVGGVGGVLGLEKDYTIYAQFFLNNLVWALQSNKKSQFSLKKF